MKWEYRELGAGPRRFLVFAFFNVISWQCIMGPALILFARHLDMPPAWVGVLISFLPLSMVFVVGTVRLVGRVGPKRLILFTWLLRDLAACAVFLVPWAVGAYGPHAGWWLLVAVSLGFCTARAFGVAGWFPWLHDLVPEGKRGLYFSIETMVVHGINVAVLVGQGLLLAGSPDVRRYLIIYAVGAATGFLSLIWIARIPGGARSPDVRESSGADAYRAALRDRGFVLLVLVASLGLSCLAWLQASMVLFMRDMVKLPSVHIMLYIATGSLGTLATIESWGRYSEGSGSGSAMLATLAGHSLLALSFVALVPGAWWTRPALAPIVAFATVFNAAFFLAANRAMMGALPLRHRVGYTNLWVVATSLALGIPPILAGQAIGRFGMWGFRICFLLSGALGLACAVTSRLVVAEGRPVDRSVTRLLNPVMPLRLLARIVWVTAGMPGGSPAGSHDDREEGGGEAE